MEISTFIVCIISDGLAPFMKQIRASENENDAPYQICVPLHFSQTKNPFHGKGKTRCIVIRFLLFIYSNFQLISLFIVAAQLHRTQSVLKCTLTYNGVVCKLTKRSSSINKRK